jgi:hypothetical protein
LQRSDGLFLRLRGPGQHTIEGCLYLLFGHKTNIPRLRPIAYFVPFSTSRTGVSGVTPPRRRA